jgi:hypothetical protein
MVDAIQLKFLSVHGTGEDGAGGAVDLVCGRFRLGWITPRIVAQTRSCGLVVLDSATEPRNLLDSAGGKFGSRPSADLID